jgi:hypothetical protein
MKGCLRASFAALLLSTGCDDTNLTVLDGRDLFQPSSLDFGTRPLGVTAELPVSLTMPATSGTLQIVGVSFDPETDAYAAHTEDGGVLRGTVITGGKTLGIRVLFAPRSSGSFDTSMLVAFQDDRAVKLELKGSGAADGAGEILVRPSSLAFSPTEVGREVLSTIQIENRGSDGAVLKEVRLRRSGLLANRGATALFATQSGTGDSVTNLEISSGSSATIDVHFRPVEIGSFEDGLSFVFASGPAISLAVTGSGIAAGMLRCDPGTIDFGALVRGQSRDSTVRCTVSGGTYTVGDVRFRLGTSNVFSLASRPASGARFQPADTFEVGVHFQSDGLPATHSGDLVVSSELEEEDLVALRAAVDPPPLSDRDLSVNARWNTGATDVDLHLVRPGGAPFDPLNDCYYQRKHQDWGQSGQIADDPYLDRDDTDGFGPEEINLADATEMRYEVYAHYFRAATTTTSVEITVYLFGTEALRTSRMISRCGDLWHVGSVRFDLATPRFDPVDLVSDARDRASCP